MSKVVLKFKTLEKSQAEIFELLLPTAFIEKKEIGKQSTKKLSLLGVPRARELTRARSK